MSSFHADLIAYGALMLASTLYSVWLESLKKAYEPDWTWATVMGGIALTGGFVALRLALHLPTLPPSQMAWWVWWAWFWGFVWSGIPIIVWQIWQARTRIRSYVAYLREGQNG